MSNEFPISLHCPTCATGRDAVVYREGDHAFIRCRTCGEATPVHLTDPEAAQLQDAQRRRDAAIAGIDALLAAVAQRVGRSTD